MDIRKATEADIPEIMLIIDEARETMRSIGNEKQWPKGSPSEAKIRSDIEADGGYIITDNQPMGYFAFLSGEDPTYAHIYNGQWLNDKSYYVIHRIAGRAGAHGLFAAILSFCSAITDNIRIDTHRDNLIVQHLLEKNGFQRCGIIYVADGTERIAYQRTL
ncbi:MAG: GNAT family N-acetyltransferase [Prevotella sp.]|jgi:RimJ/RimL family protein N-acetyltransferase|nr:GNAT family N-acetyltransferase [Prevotella sp.]